MKNPFEGINTSNKKKLFKLLGVHIYTFETGQNILSIIKDDNIIGIIDKGHAEIVRIDYDGNRSIIDELHKDSLFGTKISSIDSNEFEIIAKEKSTVIVIDYNRLIDSKNINFNPYNIFLQNIFIIINESSKEKNRRIRVLTKRTIRNKLLEYFKLEQSNKCVYLPFSFTDFADYLAVDRCAMYRELKCLKNEGFIKVKGKRITIMY